MSRKEDLEELIRRSYKVIIANETQMQTEPDPQRKLSQGDRINENWNLIEGYIEEYVPIILNHPDTVLPNDIEQIISRFPSGATLVTEQAKVIRRKIVSHWQAWEGITEVIDKYQMELKLADSEEKKNKLDEAILELTQRQKEIEMALIHQENSLNELVLAPNLEPGLEINKFRVIQIRLESVNTIVDQIDEIISRIPRQLATQFDRLSQQIETLKKELVVAINEGQREDIEDLSKELDMQLKRQQDRREKRATAYEMASNYYKQGTVLWQDEFKADAVSLFEKAETNFREAIKLSTLTDPETKGILVDLGNSIAMQGKLEESIPFYELSLQLAPTFAGARIELAKRYWEIGCKYYTQLTYSQAARNFELAHSLMPSEDYKQWIAHALNEDANSVLFSLGESAIMLDWDRAKFKMIRAIFLQPENEVYHDNLKTMQTLRRRPILLINNDHKLLPKEALPSDQMFMEIYVDEALPPKIAYWLQLFLPEFRELVSNVSIDVRHPIHIWWFENDEKSVNRLPEIGVGDMTSVSIACSHFYNGSHYIILNSSYFAKLDELSLLGTLFHELSHEAWKALGGSANLPDWTASSLTHLSSERIADYLTIYKGLGEFLLASRRQLEGGEGIEGDYPALTSAEIARILRRDLESEGKRLIKVGAELVMQDKRDEANGIFASSANIWKRVILEDPSYAFGWFEFAIALEWLGYSDDAVHHAFIAVSLDRNPRYRSYYERLRFSREEESRKHMNNGVTLKKRGQVKKAQQLFQLAEAIWNELSDRYFDVARVHYELGLCYEWQDRIDEALHEFIIASSLDRYNEHYAQYFRACAERYSIE